jgi:mono/diheme cytochrome c family protein
VLALLLAAACADSRARSTATDAAAPAAAAARYGDWPDPLRDMPRGQEQLLRLCARAGDDPLRSLFCGDEPPAIGSIVDLETALGVDSANLKGINGLSIAGHSTSLSARSISSINPRVIIVRIEPPAVDADGNPAAPGSQPGAPELLALAFARGEQFVELMVRDRDDLELRFYVLAFRQACNAAADSCKPGELLTPEIESNWLETSLYDERDLADTTLDCAPCHQPDGPGSRKLLRMQELHTPWTHWFAPSTPGGQALIADYVAAKGDEGVAGVSGWQVQHANPVNLNLQVVYAGPNTQPNSSDWQAIEAEVKSSAAAKGGDQPRDNSIAGESATWRAGYERALRGEAITFPYHDVKVSDPIKLARMSEAYQAYQRGELAARDLPDIRDVFPDDPARLAEMGQLTPASVSGEDVLLQACSTCHNARLDPTLSRARFRADLAGIERAEKDVAIERLRLPPSDPHAMPPARLRALTDEARAQALDALAR